MVKTPHPLWGVALGVTLACGLLGAPQLHARIPEAQRKGLASASVKLRLVAIAALVHSKDDEARILLQGIVLHDVEPTVRAAALDALAKREDVAAIDVVVAAQNDDDPFVKETAARVLLALRVRQTPVDISASTDRSGAKVAGIADRLRQKVAPQLRASLGPMFYVSENPEPRGYALILDIRSINAESDKVQSTVTVRCEATVVENPGQIMRLVLASTATAGVEGMLDEKTKRELISDGIDACGPALAKDFLDYVQQRTLHRKQRRNRTGWPQPCRSAAVWRRSSTRTAPRTATLFLCRPSRCIAHKNKKCVPYKKPTSFFIKMSR